MELSLDYGINISQIFLYSYKENFLVYYVYCSIFKKGTKPLFSGSAGNDSKRKKDYIST